MSGELWHPERHMTLDAPAWDEDEAREEIALIVADTRAQFSPATFWPAHPSETNGAEATADKTLYLGATGVIWALDFLGEAKAADKVRLPVDWVALTEENRKFSAQLANGNQSLLMGDTGVLLTRWRAEKTNAIAEALERTIRGNQDNPVLELMWGAPGTMLAALTMHEWTKEPRWAALYRESAQALEHALAFDEDNRCWLWTQHLYGNRLKLLGAVHGFAGNAAVLIRGRRLLDEQTWQRWSERISETIEKTATRSDGLANWAMTIGAPRPGAVQMLVQHCHGAPGVVTSLASHPGTIDDLLLAAGELTWKAGPLRKGANLCHGTAGNGFAFLKLFQRTGDQRWLDRARAYAMQAIAQSNADFNAHGTRHFSLWTGDLGLAIYLWMCIQARADFPTVDVF